MQRLNLDRSFRMWSKRNMFTQSVHCSEARYLKQYIIKHASECRELTDGIVYISSHYRMGITNWNEIMIFQDGDIIYYNQLPIIGKHLLYRQHGKIYTGWLRPKR